MLWQFLKRTTGTQKSMYWWQFWRKQTSGCIPDWVVTAFKGISVTETRLRVLYFKDKQLPTVQGKPYQRRLVKLLSAGYWQSIANTTCKSLYIYVLRTGVMQLLYIIHTYTSKSNCSNKKNNLLHVRETKLPSPHPLPPDGGELLILLLDNTGATFHLEQKRINF